MDITKLLRPAFSARAQVAAAAAAAAVVVVVVLVQSVSQVSHQSETEFVGIGSIPTNSTPSSSNLPHQTIHPRGDAEEHVRLGAVRHECTEATADDHAVRFCTSDQPIGRQTSTMQQSNIERAYRTGMSARPVVSYPHATAA